MSSFPLFLFYSFFAFIFFQLLWFCSCLSLKCDSDSTCYSFRIFSLKYLLIAIMQQSRNLITNWHRRSLDYNGLTTLQADVFSSLGQLTHLFVGFNIVIIAWRFFSSIPYQFSLRLFSIKEAGKVFRLKLLCINLDKLYFTFLVVTHFLLGHVFV
jgi:hypothetical protein